jgi:hypothetical protein
MRTTPVRAATVRERPVRSGVLEPHEARRVDDDSVGAPGGAGGTPVDQREASALDIPREAVGEGALVRFVVRVRLEVEVLPNERTLLGLGSSEGQLQPAAIDGYGHAGRAEGTPVEPGGERWFGEGGVGDERVGIVREQFAAAEVAPDVVRIARLAGEFAPAIVI